MKKALLYLLIFSYSTIIFKPVLPTISDLVAHICWYSEHVATVHCEHGKYHVHIEYEAVAKKGCPEKNNPSKESESAGFHLPLFYTYSFTAYQAAARVHTMTSSGLPVLYSNADYPPPKFV